MANTGRTVSKYNRLYLGNSTIGLDLSCNTMSVGEAGIDFDMDAQAAYCWEVKGGLPDWGNITLVFPTRVGMYRTAQVAGSVIT